MADLALIKANAELELGIKHTFFSFTLQNILSREYLIENPFFKHLINTFAETDKDDQVVNYKSKESEGYKSKGSEMKIGTKGSEMKIGTKGSQFIQTQGLLSSQLTGGAQPLEGRIFYLEFHSFKNIENRINDIRPIH